MSDPLLDQPFVGIGFVEAMTGRWTTLTPGLCTLLGVPARDLEEGVWPYPFEEEVSLALLRDLAGRQARASTPLVHEWTARSASGERLIVQAHVSWAMGPGAVLPLVRVVLRDVTGERRAQNALHESENRFATLANNASVLVWMAGTDKLCFYFNQVWLAFTGRTHEQEYGNGWTEGVHPDDFEQCLATYVTAFDRHEEFTMEYRLRHASGEYRWLLDHGVPTYDARGTFLGYIGSCLDISEKKKNETDILEANQKLLSLTDSLRKANEDLERFAYVASHDLREPLRMISCYLSLIERRLGSAMTGELAEFFGFAVDGARRMDRMVLDLLAYSRVGRRGEDRMPVPLGEVVQEGLLNLKVAVAEAGAVVEVAAPLPVVRGHRSELARLFQNLLENAIKYRALDRPCRIEVGGREDACENMVWVKDNGPGIEPAYHARVFELFQRLVPREACEGTGLGLALCKKIVESHGGRVWIESQAGQGCAFWMAFPKPS
ncbi:sensor histidine kinase [Pararhodospirillum oryzae]|uniref:histidine kinase n=1 Tax=Pararhodospirillum oryzae TaxID=478448 RepID=A0A512H5P9_9PROT|nr:PAS domain-containing sensor histidine kinase [Pararhodospirillum oryzae]GEO80782.1 hypothetical protein ROR02_09130 [Pararhodospirillum oryzae]